jgi:hypothetical protein
MRRVHDDYQRAWLTLSHAFAYIMTPKIAGRTVWLRQRPTMSIAASNLDNSKGHVIAISPPRNLLIYCH